MQPRPSSSCPCRALSGLAPRWSGRVTFAAEQLPEGVESRRARGIAATSTAVSEATARSMVESAGFDPVTVSWVPIAGEHRLIGAVLRVVAGADLQDIVLGMKPVGTASD